MEQTKPDCRCTWFDLRDLSILPHGWVMIRREEPGLESFGIKYLGEGFDPLMENSKLEAENERLRKLINKHGLGIMKVDDGKEINLGGAS